jgi:hypothetical protein
MRFDLVSDVSFRGNNVNQDELLKELREEAIRRNMSTCEQIMRELLKLMEVREALQIALKQVSTYLPIFESHHPEKVWPRAWVELTSKYEPIDYSSHDFEMFTDFYEDYFGSQAFINAIQLLDGAFRAYFQGTPDVTINLAADAIANMASAKMSAYLSVKIPSIWLRFRKMFDDQNTFSEEEKWEISKEFKQNSERGNFIESFWTELADEISKASK